MTPEMIDDWLDPSIVGVPKLCDAVVGASRKSGGRLVEHEVEQLA